MDGTSLKSSKFSPKVKIGVKHFEIQGTNHHIRRSLALPQLIRDLLQSYYISLKAYIFIFVSLWREMLISISNYFNRHIMEPPLLAHNLNRLCGEPKYQYSMHFLIQALDSFGS